jgi:serralysin
MAEYLAYSPDTVMTRAMFNYDAQGGTDFTLKGTIRVSVSDSFTKADYTAAGGNLSSDVYTNAASGNANWSQAQIDNINIVLQTYMSFIPVSFTTVKNLSGLDPADVGLTSDINISLIARSDLPFAGESALSTDLQFLYNGSRGDIVINSAKIEPNPNFPLTWYSGHVLMHEIGHELGLAHPHIGFVNGNPILTTDFIATDKTGFDQLGFVIHSGLDMNKEYFTVMSYDDQIPADGNTFAQTPMILDVIALQTAYGEGRGSSGSSDDTIAPGQDGLVSSYRTYFDTGGIDTIDLVNYAKGAYLHMGASIEGARHLVGVSMSMDDEALMASGGSPQSLRWFYGEFENALGSAVADRIIGNALANTITGRGGDDVIEGGEGIDISVYRGMRSEYTLRSDAGVVIVADTVAGRDGTDRLSHVEDLRFSDGTLVLDIAPEDGVQVYALYRVALGRTPDEAGFRYWTAVGQAPGDLAKDFAISLEFTTDVPGQPPNAFVTALYESAFGRVPDAAGLAYWTGALQHGVTHDQVVSSFAGSAEVLNAVSAANQTGFWLA